MWILSGGTDCTQDGGVKADVWDSTNGVTWTRATASTPFGERWTPGAVVFQGKIWVIGGLGTGGYNGYHNDVWTSTDGANWTEVNAAAPFAGRESFGCVVFNNKIWVIAGDNSDGLAALSDVWSSPDGVNWTREPDFPSARTGAACVVFNGAIWVIGGGYTAPDPSAGSNAYMVYSFNDAWYSTDGANWIQATANAGFAGRVYATAQVYNNQIWMLGGVDSSYMQTILNNGVFDDLWVSNDGANWTQACPTLPFPSRCYAESYVFNDQFWVVGGFSISGNNAVYYPDIWHTH